MNHGEWYEYSASGDRGMKGGRTKQIRRQGNGHTWVLLRKTRSHLKSMSHSIHMLFVHATPASYDIVALNGFVVGKFRVFVR